MAPPPWKLDLQPASFNGAQFHVEVQTRAGGRRVAMHEFPKKSVPYGEDMGRRARSFAIVGYLIGPGYQFDRDEVIGQLEIEGAGTLVLPTSFDQKSVICERYSCSERRERGGYAEIEMLFVEAGQDPSVESVTDTQGAVTGAADDAIGLGNDTGNSLLNSSDITAIT